MTEPAEGRDDDRFEEVLGRLDALVRRGQPMQAPPPPPSGMGEIPVLTEVYRPDQGQPAGPLPLTDAFPAREPGLDAVAPLLAQVLDEVLAQKLRPALETALSSTMEELRPQLEDWLREALRRALEPGTD